MVRRSLYALGLFLATAIPASAGVTVGSITASQYDYPYFSAMVQATGTTVLGDIYLTATGPNGTVLLIQPDTIDRTNLDGYGLYVIYQIRKYNNPNVVNPGDTLTAVVTDQNGEHGEKSVLCVAPLTRKKTSETATCK
jgi:hypothetical protein